MRTDRIRLVGRFYATLRTFLQKSYKINYIALQSQRRPYKIRIIGNSKIFVTHVPSFTSCTAQQTHPINRILLGYYAARSDNFLPTFRKNLPVPSSGFWNPHHAHPISVKKTNQLMLYKEKSMQNTLTYFSDMKKQFLNIKYDCTRSNQQSL